MEESLFFLAGIAQGSLFGLFHTLSFQLLWSSYIGEGVEQSPTLEQMRLLSPFLLRQRGTN